MKHRENKLFDIWVSKKILKERRAEIEQKCE